MPHRHLAASCSSGSFLSSALVFLQPISDLEKAQANNAADLTLENNLDT